MKNRPNYPTLAVLATGGMLAAGCVVVPGVEVTALPTRIDYACAGGKTLPVARAPEQRMAAVLIDGREILLRAGESAAQEKYTDGQYSLYLDGEKAFLEENGIVLFGPCTSPVPLSTYYRTH